MQTLEHTIDTDLGQKNIGRLLLQYSIPAIVATVATSLYNLIDRIFIGQVIGALAISGVTITMPLMNIATAFGMLVSTGAASIISIRLGANRRDDAEQTFGNGMILTLLISVLLSAVGLYFLDDLLYLFGASGLTISYARNFMRIILIGNPITQAFFYLNSVLRSSGYPSKAMWAVLVTMVVNVLMVYVFVYLLDLGVDGAALATIWGQTAGFAWVMWHFCHENSHIHFKKHIYGLRWNIIRHVFSIGLSPYLLHLCTCMVVALFNWQLGKYAGDYAIGAYGIINTIVSLVTVFVVGLSHGMQPIVGYNYGASQPTRVTKTLWMTIWIGVGITIVGYAVMNLFPEQLAACFTQNVVMTDLICSGMQLFTMAFPILGFQIVVSIFFQSIGRARLSIFLSLTRQVIFLVPLLIILPQYMGLKGIWLSVPISDFVSTVVTGVLLILNYNKIVTKFE
ncbi:MAG: MATE family efflux transporter [Bacteroidales bacterium]|nr:MATE family efflux transporter [Bacteroidales bacterium]